MPCTCSKNFKVINLVLHSIDILYGAFVICYENSELELFHRQQSFQHLPLTEFYDEI